MPLVGGNIAKKIIGSVKHSFFNSSGENLSRVVFFSFYLLDLDQHQHTAVHFPTFLLDLLAGSIYV